MKKMNGIGEAYSGVETIRNRSRYEERTLISKQTPVGSEKNTSDRKAKENIYHLSKFLFCFEFIHKQDVN